MRWVLDVLEPLGPLRTKRMFGGHGFWIGDPALRGELFFALVAGGVLHVKTDAANRGRFEALGLEPFRPFPDRDTVMGYHPVPGEALEDPETLREYAREGIAAALRARGRR